MIEINNLFINYDKEAILKNINLKINSLETIAIIGPSGCGKTTFLYGIGGLLKPTKGSIKINNEELLDIRTNTGVILQNYGLLPWLTVRNNLGLGLKTRGVPKNNIKLKVEEMAENLGIHDKLDKYPKDLSGGQKQRVAIGRTLILEPDLLLMDEASSSLDQITKESIQNLILSIYKKNPFTMIFVTHSIEEAVFLGKRIIIMNNGEINKIIENPYFGEDNLRLNEGFYKLCIQVRKALEEGYCE